MKRHNYQNWLSVTLIELRAVSAALTQARDEENDLHELKRKADHDYYAGGCFDRGKPARTIWRRANIIQARARCSAKYYAHGELIQQLRDIQRLLEHDIETAIAKHYARIARRGEAKSYSKWFADDPRRDYEMLFSALRGESLPPPQRGIPWIHEFTAVLDLHT